jgi:hypothetical protein
MKGVFGYEGNFETFLRDKKTKRGEWAKHVQEWIMDNASFDKRRLLIVKYEDLRRRPENITFDILNFIGIEAEKAMVDKAVQNASFENMRRLEDQFGTPMDFNQPQFRFMRKGKSGYREEDLQGFLTQFFSDNKHVFQFLGYEENPRTIS